MTGAFILGDVKAERAVLENMEKVGVVAFPIGAPMRPEEELPFNRACEAEYIRLVNIRNVSIQTPKGPLLAACATYALTARGRARLTELRERERLSKIAQ